ncbi:MAG: ABC transporter ATP-binding protein [Desulforhabdus sp.]|jgi:branched-chain amino acid transport system ATP-binding protein|nr:ABC transporter ATP-binding protein [Desulforhabdus sp.]
MSFEPLLETRELVKSFGAMMVSAGIDLFVRQGEIHAIIGPNGAGKTTLIAQLAGELRPDSGTITLCGKNITRLPMHARSSLGIARSFQITSIFQGFSVLDNVVLALQANNGHNFRFWRNAGKYSVIRRSALEVLDRVGLAERAHIVAGNLSHGEQRQLEVAMALGTRPKLLLLDEPMAGMGAEESERMISVLRGLKQEHTLVLVEHDMAAVFALADWITVLVYGRVIAGGTIDQIRSDPDVREAYLGDEEALAVYA